jgi:hypothetical protein
MKKVLVTFSVAMLMLSAMTIVPTGSGVAVAQNRHVFIEEFTGSWCGWCPRGAYAMQVLDKKYPGKVFCVAYHNGDPMSTKQGDSITSAKGFPSSAVVPGFPDSWITRTPYDVGNGPTWNVDPLYWVAPLPGINDDASTPGIVDGMVDQTTPIVVGFESATYNASTNQVTAKVTAHVLQSVASGDYRITLMVTEDSVVGPDGTTYDQHNYYTANNQGGNWPNNPFYNMPGVIPGWAHMHVFRMAFPSVKGAAGIIPQSPAMNTPYSTTFTFKLPSTIDPRHAHMIAIVHQYSATGVDNNTVYDAAESPLSATPIPTVTLNVSSDKPSYMMANAGSTTTFNLTVSNPSDISANVDLALSNSVKLPTGWKVDISPSNVDVAGKASQNVAVTVTAPTASAFIMDTITLTPTAEGAYAPQRSFGFGLLSSNTKGIMYQYSYLTSGQISAGVGTALAKGPIANAATVPFSSETDAAYGGMDLDFVGYANLPAVDWISDNGTNNNYPSVIKKIDDMLAHGKKIFITSLWAASDALSSGNPDYTTDDAMAFFTDTLGLTLQNGTATSRVSGNNYASYNIKAFPGQPIGTGIPTLTLNTGTPVLYTPSEDVFTTPTPGTSTPIFYSDNVQNHVVGVTYTSGSGAKLVYLSFTLDNLGTQKYADTVTAHSLNWLATTVPEGNADVAVLPQAAQSFVAMPSLFHGATQVAYTAGQNERDVTFAAFDVLGRQVGTLPVKASGTSYTMTFDASALPAGAYTIVKHSSEGSKELRVVNE